ncbi:CHRD domain-containing protein [Algoriphagus alkaliphilus]|nr:CHRD domain-containing protein [Algoriphagus alkaliphilus]
MLSGQFLGGDLMILKEAFRTGNAYVNVYTANFGSGELRGNF